MRQTAVFPVADLPLLKRQLLNWAAAHPVSVCLDSNGHSGDGYHSWECLAAAGAADFFQAKSGQAFPDFKVFWEKKRDWLFGFFGYDLKNELEKLYSAWPDGIGLPDLYFFQPETVAGIRRKKDAAGQAVFQLEIFSLDDPPEVVLTRIFQAKPAANTEMPRIGPLQPVLSKSEYLATVEAIRRHIVEGDLYEMNLCQEFFAKNARIDPLDTFRRLNAIGRAPFSAWLRLHGRYLLCASPERFLRREGAKLISQPIKGTRRRGQTPEEDAVIRRELAASEKDRAENVMIVDLVRNDLARNCLPGSVQVEELFGIYTFETVHQMISTVSGRLRPEAHPLDALRDAFPMGSMTGAPKVMAMELIERYERSRRGLYSGAVGYFSPNGDFDFNVVIRSILYHAAAGYLSIQAGGAIVYDSVPEKEYEECLLKAEAMLQALTPQSFRL